MTLRERTGKEEGQMTGSREALRTRLLAGLEHLLVIPAFQRLREKDFQVSEQPGPHRVLGQNKLRPKSLLLDLVLRTIFTNQYTGT